MDRLASITVFVRAESGGFTAAARRLNLSTTTVSDHVRELENALGARLLNRTMRRVSLTEIGSEYYERCSQTCTSWRKPMRPPARCNRPPRSGARLAELAA